MPCYKGDDHVAVKQRSRTRSNDEPAVRRTCEGCDGAFDVVSAAQLDWLQLHSQRLCHGLDDCPLSNRRSSRFSQDGYARNSGRDFLEKFKPLAAQTVFKLNGASRVAARSR